MAAGVRGLCTVLVTSLLLKIRFKFKLVTVQVGVEASCQSWRIQSSTRELPLAIVTLTLCRNSEFSYGRPSQSHQPPPPSHAARRK